jgi:hypothetical protein
MDDVQATRNTFTKSLQAVDGNNLYSYAPSQGDSSDHGYGQEEIRKIRIIG